MYHFKPWPAIILVTDCKLFFINISWFHFLKSENQVIVLISNYGKCNIFEFMTAGKTKQNV